MSDSSAYAKLLNLLYKFTTRKQDDMPLFHGNDIPEFIRASSSNPLIKGKLSKISEVALDKLIYNLSDDYNTSISAIGVMIDGVLVKEHYVKPFSNLYRHVTYSMCKSVISMAIGIAVDKGFVRLDEKISDIFTEKDSIFWKKNMKSVTVEHLLTMTSCVSFDEINSYFHMDWQKAFMGSDLEGMPGEDFYYNSLNSYMLASIIVKRTNKSLMEFLQENLFSYLGINDISWDKCPMGIEKGGWGMKLSLTDMLKLGQLVLDEGTVCYQGEKKQLISKEWIKEATTTKVLLEKKDIIKGYGYHIWTLKDGSYLFNGLFGQNVYINPNRNMVIAVFASSYAIFPDEKLVGGLVDFASNDSNFIKDKVDIVSKTKNLIKQKISIKTNKSNNITEIKDFVLPFNGKQYVYNEYTGSILPIISQFVYSNFTSGIRTLKVDLTDNILKIDVIEKFVDKLDITDENRIDSYTILVNFEEEYSYQILNIGGKEMPVATSAYVSVDEYNRKYLALNISYLEEVSDRTIMFYYEDDKLRIKMIETPNLKLVVKRLVEDDLVFRTRGMSKFDVPDYVKYKFESIISPDTVGEENK